MESIVLLLGMRRGGEGGGGCSGAGILSLSLSLLFFFLPAECFCLEFWILEEIIEAHPTNGWEGAPEWKYLVEVGQE